MTHFIYPEVSGFQESGGYKGFGQDYLASPTGDMTVATKYMKAAGYPSGKYTGSKTVQIVGSNADPGPQEMQIVQQGLTALGFKTSIKAVPQQTMYSKFCGYVKAQINIVPDGRVGSRTSPTRTPRCSCRSAATRSCRSTTATGPC